MSDVSAVIVDYYTRDRTLDLVRDLQSREGVAEVIVVDNTGDAQYAASWPRLTRTRVVFSEGRAGFGEGVNRGAREVAPGSVLLILNSDLKILEGSVTSLCAKLAESGLGAIAPRILSSDGQPQVDAVGAFPDVRTSHSGPDWITGACLLVEHATFVEVGGFDERYFMYWEDVDFCRKLWSLGLRVGVDDALVVSHQSGGSDASPASRYARARVGRDRYYAKWQPRSPIRLVLRASSLAKLLWLTWRHG